MTDERADGVFLTVHLCRDHVGMAAIRSGARAMKVSPRQIETNADCDLYLLDTRGRLWRRSLGEHWQELELPDDPGPIPQDSSSNADSTPDDTSDPILDIQSVRRERDELKRLLRQLADDVDGLKAELAAEKKYVEQLNRGKRRGRNAASGSRCCAVLVRSVFCGASQSAAEPAGSGDAV
jgi:hypothetical protein